MCFLNSLQQRGRTKSAHSKLSHPKFFIPLTVQTVLTQHTANPILKARTACEPEAHSNQTRIRKPRLRAAERATTCARWNQQIHKIKGSEAARYSSKIRTANCTKLGVPQNHSIGRRDTIEGKPIELHSALRDRRRGGGRSCSIRTWESTPVSNISSSSS